MTSAYFWNPAFALVVDLKNIRNKVRVWHLLGMYDLVGERVCKVAERRGEGGIRTAITVESNIACSVLVNERFNANGRSSPE